MEWSEPDRHAGKLLENLHQHQAKLLEQHLRLQLRYQAHKYKSERGREYTFNGFNRGFSERSSKCSRFCRRSAKTFQNLWLSDLDYAEQAGPQSNHPDQQRSVIVQQSDARRLLP